MASLVQVADDDGQGDAAGGGNGEAGAGENGNAVPDGGPAGADGDANSGPAPERPEFIPEEAWDPEKGYDRAKHLEILRSETRPESADAYDLPDIDGFDKETAGKSPLVAALRKSAHAAGLDQEGFNAAVSEYVAESVRMAEAAHNLAMQELGENAATRTAAIGRWLGANLPKSQANALAASLTSAEAVIAFEQIMNGGRKSGGDPPPAPTRETRAEIEALMNSKAYMGKAAERDPAVIKRVDDWFKAEAAAKAGK